MDNEEFLKMERELGRIDGSVKSAHRRIDSLEKVVNVVYELSSSVKVMAEKMNYMNDNISDIKNSVKNDISNIRSNIDEYHHKEPNKLIFNAKNAVITGIIAVLVAAIMGLILK